MELEKSYCNSMQQQPFWHQREGAVYIETCCHFNENAIRRQLPWALLSDDNIRSRFLLLVAGRCCDGKVTTGLYIHLTVYNIAFILTILLIVLTTSVLYYLTFRLSI